MQTNCRDEIDKLYDSDNVYDCSMVLFVYVDI
jgi:hypothetical protein